VLALHHSDLQLAIDDFGTGRCSLARVLSLPIDIVKIGRAFIAELGRSPRANPPAAAIIAMAHASGRKVIAKGVETQAQRVTLKRVGCDRAQGYLLGRPGAAADTFPSVRDGR
jgi:EAL domain-containing protein (putative c-di-GMP-specific phosphodiesterase class I)